MPQGNKEGVLLSADRRPRVLAIASGGGHWEQLMLLRDAFAGAEIRYVTTLPGLAERSGVTASIVSDCNRNEPFKAALCFARVLWILISFRPHAIVSTGALPGFFAIAAGRLVRARTMWVDSVANAEEPSMAGRLALRHATRWVSQWPDVAQEAGGEFHGAVL